MVYASPPPSGIFHGGGDNSANLSATPEITEASDTAFYEDYVFWRRFGAPTESSVDTTNAVSSSLMVNKGITVENYNLEP